MRIALGNMLAEGFAGDLGAGFPVERAERLFPVQKDLVLPVTVDVQLLRREDAELAGAVGIIRFIAAPLGDRVNGRARITGRTRPPAGRSCNRW